MYAIRSYYEFVAAESFTGGGYDAPAAYKNLADYWFAQGLNRVVIHSSAHQPLDTKPGNTMVGTHFNRNITWAEQAGPVMDYLSRVSVITSYSIHYTKLYDSPALILLLSKAI